MARRNTRSRNRRRSPVLVPALGGLMSSVAFLAAVLSKVWPV